jgi:phosphoglycolate phosphatase
MDGPGRELPLDLVAFDLDGTLVDTAAEIAGTLNDVLGSVGLRPVAEPLVRDWIGNGSRALLIRACMDTTGLTESEVQRSCSLDALLQRYTRCYAVRAGTASRLYPEVGESLRELSACGLARSAWRARCCARTTSSAASTRSSAAIRWRCANPIR